MFRGHTDKFVGGKEGEGEEESKDCNHLTVFTSGSLGARHQEFSVFLWQIFCKHETALICVCVCV